jgi:Icc-related predicted phosphoesterase
MSKTLKIISLSDTHNAHKNIIVQPCDLLIHAGDATIGGEVDELESFANWFEKQPAKYKIFIAGNHERCLYWFKDAQRMEKMLADKGIIYLNNSEIIIDGLKIYGSPNTPTFGQWAFMKDRSVIHEEWAKIPDDTQILITHGPAYKLCDSNLSRFSRTNSYDHLYVKDHHCGCIALFNRLNNLEIPLFLFGHIHPSGGENTKYKKTACYNVASFAPVTKDKKKYYTELLIIYEDNKITDIIEVEQV